LPGTEEHGCHLLPPDKLASYSIFWEGDPEKFREIFEELPEDIVRSKGYFMDTESKWKVFDSGRIQAGIQRC
jgi:hypothetical protein